MSAKNSKSKAAETTTKVKGPKENKSNLVYVGPTIVGVIKHGEVFEKGILPDKAKECLTELPAMEKLFVTEEKFPEAVKELRRKQSLLNAICGETIFKFQRR